MDCEQNGLKEDLKRSIEVMRFFQYRHLPEDLKVFSALSFSMAFQESFYPERNKRSLRPDSSRPGNQNRPAPR